MSERDVRLFLLDILEAIGKVQSYITGLDQDGFVSNDMVIDAVVRNLEVIGEAAKRIPQHLRDVYSDIEWHRVVGFRNIAIHTYFDVDTDIVWVIASQQLAPLRQLVERMLADLGPPGSQ